MTTETFTRKNFRSEGIWFYYIREDGTKMFIARFKHRGGATRTEFKAALVGTSVDAYKSKLDAGIAPMKAAPGLYETWMERVGL